MGSILLWLGRGLYLGGGAIIGVMFEKISSWVAGLLPSSVKVTDKSGGLAWWFITAVAVASGIVLYIVTKAITGKKKLLAIAALCAAVDYLAFGSVDVIMATLLFSIAASSSDSKSINYCPEFITFNIGTVPTAFKIEVVGDGVIFALDGTGLTNLNGIRCMGSLPSGQYIYQIANGFIGKNTTFTITNAHAGQLDIYGFSNSRGNTFVLHNMAKAFANASLALNQFLYAAFPSAAATDSFTITWSDGTVQNMTRLEAVSYLAYKQQVADTRYNFDNYQNELSQIQFIGAADQSIYYQRAAAQSGAVRQSL